MAAVPLERGELLTPIGRLTVIVGPEGLCAIAFESPVDVSVRRLERRFGALAFADSRDPGGVVGRLRAYFAGDLTAIDSIAADPGGTSFQAQVWSALRRIPCGATSSYADLARSIGRSRALRAVGLANGQNPIPIVIPCHRVIGANGSLTGYGGGLDVKRWLLVHEGALLA